MYILINHLQIRVVYYILYMQYEKEYRIAIVAYSYTTKVLINVQGTRYEYLIKDNAFIKTRIYFEKLLFYFLSKAIPQTSMHL